MIEILQNRGVLHITGPDAGKFLQSMVTNDVVKNIYSYNYLLTNQGRFLFDFFVYQEAADSYFLDVNKSGLDDLQKRLMIYKLRSDFKVQDVSLEYRILYSKSAIKSDVKFSEHDPRYNKLGWRSLIEASKIDQLAEIAGGLYDLDKYKYAIADGSVDLIYDRSIPVEYGAEELNAINYHKGCYIGQEVISRVKHQGVVRKKIFRLYSDEDIIVLTKQAQVTDLSGNELGVVCSNYRGQAIALLSEEKILGLGEKLAMINEQIVKVEVPAWRG
jgi:hypothetical protein